MKKWIISIIILIVYIGTMILPYYATKVENIIDIKSTWLQLQFGIIHIPSMVYIFLIAILLHIFLGKKVISFNKIKKEIKQAQEALENKDLKIENEFIQNIIKIIKYGGIEEDIELSIKKKFMEISQQYEELLTNYGYISAILPMLGMLGTITGLLQMFAVSDGIDNIAQKMVGLSIALATTLYATLWVILITKPKAREIETKLIELENLEKLLSIDAKLFFHTTNIDLIENENETE